MVGILVRDKVILVTNDLRFAMGMMDQSANEHPPGKPLIFVLDDNTLVLEALRLTLKGSGYKVVCFTDETRLFRRMQHHSPKCIFLDVGLPGRSGLEILRDLATYPAPVILMSEEGNIPMAVNAIKNGAVDFIQKPFRREEILNKLANLTTGVPHAKPDTLSFSFPGKGALSYRERQIVRLLVLLSQKVAGDN
jgi:FixJ family two-component response regulator